MQFFTVLTILNAAVLIAALSPTSSSASPAASATSSSTTTCPANTWLYTDTGCCPLKYSGCDLKGCCPPTHTCCGGGSCCLQGSKCARTSLHGRVMCMPQGSRNATATPAQFFSFRAPVPDTENTQAKSSGAWGAARVASSVILRPEASSSFALESMSTGVNTVNERVGAESSVLPTSVLQETTTMAVAVPTDHLVVDTSTPITNVSAPEGSFEKLLAGGNTTSTTDESNNLANGAGTVMVAAWAGILGLVVAGVVGM
ncbi:hypothetical protein EDC01DRAFT_392315 [Geopyxis carbonaria]|nr:hypothetical protein EDC01DRAFT_392315 [Geopyxis carbonaria]